LSTPFIKKLVPEIGPEIYKPFVEIKRIDLLGCLEKCIVIAL
jgi:hypothetical protein